MRGLIRSELYKLLLDGKRWIIAAAILAAKCAFCFAALKVNVDFSPEIYRQYIETLAEIPQESRAEYLDKEARRLDETISSRAQTEAYYHADKLTLDEFKEYMRRYYVAQSRQPALYAVAEKFSAYEALPPENRIYYYDLNWEALFGFIGFDCFLFFAAAVVLVPCFCRKYACGIFPLIAATERGSAELYKAKMIAAVGTMLLLSALFSAADFAVYGTRFGYEFADMPIQTVRGVVCSFPSLSIAQYMLLQTGIRLLWSVSLAAVICMLSVLLKNALLTFLGIAAAVLMPWLLSGILPLWVDRITVGGGLGGQFVDSPAAVVSALISSVLHTLAAAVAVWTNAPLGG